MKLTGIAFVFVISAVGFADEAHDGTHIKAVETQMRVARQASSQTPARERVQQARERAQANIGQARAKANQNIADAKERVAANRDRLQNKLNAQTNVAGLGTSQRPGFTTPSYAGVGSQRQFGAQPSSTRPQFEIGAQQRTGFGNQSPTAFGAQPLGGQGTRAGLSARPQSGMSSINKASQSFGRNKRQIFGETSTQELAEQNAAEARRTADLAEMAHKENAYSGVPRFPASLPQVRVRRQIGWILARQARNRAFVNTALVRNNAWRLQNLATARMLGNRALIRGNLLGARALAWGR